MNKKKKANLYLITEKTHVVQGFSQRPQAWGQVPVYTEELEKKTNQTAQNAAVKQVCSWPLSVQSQPTDKNKQDKDGTGSYCVIQ